MYPSIGPSASRRTPPQGAARVPSARQPDRRGATSTANRSASRWRLAGGWLIFFGLAWFTLVFLGLRVYPVLTGSMVPSFGPGDLVITVSPRIVAPEVGKVVVAEPYFTEGGEQLPPIAHRIIGTQSGGWRTQGDANPEPDGWTVRAQDIRRVVIASVPMDFARDPRWIAGLVGFAALVWLWPRDRATPRSSASLNYSSAHQGRRRPPGQAAHARSGRHRNH